VDRALVEHCAAALDDSREIQLPFKLKQGQVEVEEAAVVTDYSRAVLMPTAEIKQLNADIRRLGGAKVGLLEEIRDFRRGIVQLLWDAERVQMETEDLVEKTRDFQLLRVTKDLQEVIRGGSEESQAEETEKLERKLEQLQVSHADRLADLRRQQRKVAKLVADKKTEMESLSGQIEQLEGSVSQREKIHDVQSRSKGAASDKANRFEEVHMKTKLHSLVKMQAQEIELLRDELDRLRRRTFPTFTHIEAVRSAEAGLG
jgi:chromosome segregation ATPase